MMNPSVTRETNGRRADTQECLGLKPCWETRMSRASVRNGKSRRCKIFTAGHSKEIGRHEAPSVRGLPGFKIGMIVELFQMEGRSIPASERLKSSVRKTRPETPRCFRWATVSLSAVRSHRGRLTGLPDRTLHVSHAERTEVMIHRVPGGPGPLVRVCHNHLAARRQLSPSPKEYVRACRQNKIRFLCCR